MSKNITDPFLRKLYPKLADDLYNRIHVLADGGAVTHGSDGLVDAANTAMKYRADIAYIQALKEVIELCYELDHDIYGGAKQENDGDE